MGWEPVKAIRTTWYACTWYDLSELGRRHCRKVKKSWKGVRCAIVLHTHTHTHTHTHMHAPSLSLSFSLVQLCSARQVLVSTSREYSLPMHGNLPPPREGSYLCVLLVITCEISRCRNYFMTGPNL